MYKLALEFVKIFDQRYYFYYFNKGLIFLIRFNKFVLYSLSLVFFLGTSPWALTQTDSIDIIVERIIEQFVENNEITDFDNNTAFEKLYDYNRRKLNINKASYNDFSDLFFLNPIEISAIINHRTELGDFISMEELQSIPELSMETIRKLTIFVTTAETSDFDLSDLLTKGKHQTFYKFRRTLQTRAGYLPNSRGNSNYLGDPNYLYIRHRYDAGRRLKYGFTAEKDAGEQFFKGVNSNGFDFYSAYVYFEKIHPKIKTLVLGDYNLSLGQGLIINNGFGYGKSAFVTGIKRTIRPVRQYSSVNEALFYRGAAATIQLTKNFEATLAYSYKKISGNIQVDTFIDTGFERFTSLQISGLHRTESEINRKNRVVQQNAGGRISYQSKLGSISANGLLYKFDLPFIRDERIYRRNQFTGNQLFLGSVDYDFFVKNINIFGEAAMSDNGGKAMMTSALIGLDKRLDLALLYRNYDQNYQSLESSAFGESSVNNDEKGLYIGTEIRFTDQFKFSAYYDIFKHDWLKFRVDAPSEGFETFARLDYTIKRKFNTYVQYRYVNKQRNISGDNNTIRSPQDYHLHRIRWHISQKVDKSTEVRARSELSFFNQTGVYSRGSMVFADIIYKPLMKPYSFAARYGIFDVDNFDTRIYTYESDLLYEYSIPFFQNRGARYYIMTKWRVGRNMVLEARYSNTGYLNINEIGSGNEKINGSNRSDIKVQMRVTF
ncbi:MAG TPA: helix-hairpin-helix domain-containing protein [Saprospiraceae bacterium]|nr:helix-hairpin-helix domain-containing protein [Saprospiraceae bacterium]